MAVLISLQNHTDHRGSLVVIEKVLPFDIKRIFYIYGADQSVRGGHRHIETVQAAVCIKGSCQIMNHDGGKLEVFKLFKPDQCLILYPQDWHQMEVFSKDAILMVLASREYDPKDYVYQRYEDRI